MKQVKCGKCGWKDGTGDLEENARRQRRMTVEHIVPRSKGGTNHRCNVRQWCSFCNEEKGSKLLPEDADLIRRMPSGCFVSEQVRLRVLAELRRTVARDKAKRCGGFSDF